MLASRGNCADNLPPYHFLSSGPSGTSASVSHVPKFHTYRIKLTRLNTIIYDIKENNNNDIYKAENDVCMMFERWVKN